MFAGIRRLSLTCGVDTVTVGREFDWSSRTPYRVKSTDARVGQHAGRRGWCMAPWGSLLGRVANAVRHRELRWKGCGTSAGVFPRMHRLVSPSSSRSDVETIGGRVGTSHLTSFFFVLSVSASRSSSAGRYQLTRISIAKNLTSVKCE